jgi:hypothetical protein
MTTSRITSLAWFLVVLFYAIRLMLGADPASDPASNEVWRLLFHGERSILDRAEAVLWVPAIVLNSMLFLRAFRARAVSVTAGWFLAMTLLVIFLLGEEVSWGEYVFGFAPPEVMRTINAQHELNIHTLNLSYLLGIPPESFLYPFLSNFNHILNPLFYLFCCMLFIALPLAKRGGKWPVLDQIPAPNSGIVLFFSANVLAYLVVDKLIVDVAEIFEFAIATTFLLSALDIYRVSRRGEQEGRSHGAAPTRPPSLAGLPSAP